MTVLVDSDVLIEISRGRDKTLLAQWLQLAASDSALLYSPVTAAELWAGARPREHELLNRLFDSLFCVPIDYVTGKRAGDYLQRFAKSHSLELGDALIAAAAVNNDAALWTRNRKHYPMRELSFL